MGYTRISLQQGPGYLCVLVHWKIHGKSHYLKLKLVVYPIIYKVFNRITGGFSMFFQISEASTIWQGISRYNDLMQLDWLID